MKFMLLALVLVLMLLLHHLVLQLAMLQLQFTYCMLMLLCPQMLENLIFLADPSANASWRVHFNIILDLGVLAWDSILDGASALTLLLPATDVNGMTDMQLAEQITLLPSGVVWLYELLSSWTSNEIRHKRNYTYTKPKLLCP
jgi:hypothetical protein